MVEELRGPEEADTYISKALLDEMVKKINALRARVAELEEKLRDAGYTGKI